MSIPREPGGSCLVFYDLTSEVTECPSHYTLLVKAVTSLPMFSGEGTLALPDWMRGVSEILRPGFRTDTETERQSHHPQPGENLG